MRLVTVTLTTLMLPFGTFVGYEFGSGHLQTALTALAGQCTLTFIQSYIWWITLDSAGAHSN